MIFPDIRFAKNPLFYYILYFKNYKGMYIYFYKYFKISENIYEWF
jgi:hypothetical protein